MGKRLVEFHIEPSVFDELKTFAKKLPSEATGESKNGGMDAHDNPAGLALLGMINDKIDTIVPLHMSGGCWDAPNINYTDMDNGMRKMVEADRICVGMAFVRNPRWQSYRSSDEAKVSAHLKRQIHDLRNAFADIQKTIWVTLQNDYFRVYRPCYDESSRMTLREIIASQFFTKEAQDDEFIAAKLKRDAEAKAAKKKAKEDLEQRRAKWLADQKKRENEDNTRRKKAEQDKLKKIEELNQKFKDAKDESINMGNGITLIKNSEGKYILWQTSS